MVTVKKKKTTHLSPVSVQRYIPRFHTLQSTSISRRYCGTHRERKGEIHGLLGQTELDAILEKIPDLPETQFPHRKRII